VGLGDFQIEQLEQRELLSLSPAMAASPRKVVDRAGSTFATARNAGVLQLSKTFRDFVGAGDSTDFYKFKMTTQTLVDLNLTGASNKVKLALIKDKNSNGRPDRGETLAQQAGKSTTRAISKTLSPATYFIRVLQSTATNNYTLKFTAHPSDAGNTLASALDVKSPNGSIFFTETLGGDDPADFYRITFTQTTHLILSMGNLTANADISLIQDNNGNGEVDEATEVLASSNLPGASNEQITWHSAPGVYFIRVIPAGADSLTYTLQFTTFPM
jgi:hypothetical protein